MLLFIYSEINNLYILCCSPGWPIIIYIMSLSAVKEGEAKLWFKTQEEIVTHI